MVGAVEGGGEVSELNCADCADGGIRVPLLDGPDQGCFPMFSFLEPAIDGLRYAEFLDVLSRTNEEEWARKHAAWYWRDQ